jgi:conjugal transfer pilus assembly protein TraB
MRGAVPKPLATLRDSALRMLDRLSPRQRQYAMLGGILAVGIGLLWLVLASNSGGADKAVRPSTGTPSGVTNIGVMSPGQQVNPVDQWVGTAGSKLAQYESEREEQGRLNKDRQAFEANTMKRFADLEQRLTSSAQAAAMPPALPPPPPPLPPAPAGMPAFPPVGSLPTPARGASAEPALAPTLGLSGVAAGLALPAAAALTRVSVTDRAKGVEPSTRDAVDSRPNDAATGTVSTFLPVSFTRGTLIGGLDAPTGGQAQSNPHPVLIRLSDNSVLPNRFRGEYRECFVVAAGYGDISSERAYLRTESLSCVRNDGTALEVKIQGSVYGEDGKVGMRGRLVTKQGQMLANALLAGVVGGIGQGVATASTTYSTSPLGAVGTAQGSDAYKAGIGTGVGRALDRLAQYYIKLAENTFPVIEIDAAREIDVVITRGVRIDAPATPIGLARRETSPRERYMEASDDRDY